MAEAVIIAIGSEILKGVIRDTNSYWIIEKLLNLGIETRKVMIIRDNIDDIIDSFQEAVRIGDIVISTGGLGPTPDDLTSEGIARAFNRRLVLNREALRLIQKRLEERGIEINEYREKMAYLPSGAKPLSNPVGVAPGILLEENNKVIIALPGVPREMKAIFESEVSEILMKRFKIRKLFEEVLEIEGLYEADITPILKDVKDSYPNIYVKSMPKESKPKPKIKIVMRAWDKATIKKAVNYLKRKIEELG